MMAPHPSSPLHRPARANAVREEAAEWLVRRWSGATAPEEAQFQAWLSADESHPAAYAAVQRTWSALNEPRQKGHLVALERELRGLQRRRERQNRMRVFTAVAGLAAAAVTFALLVPGPRLTTAPAGTVSLRPDRQLLPDGSTVELRSGAEIVVAFSPERRGVQLVRGEAWFTVATDADRPFIVSAGTVAVRAVGTEFSVNHERSAVAVLVTEGRVAVARTSGEETGAAAEATTEPTYLGAGDRVVIPSDLPVAVPLVVVPVAAGQVAADLAWRGQRVEFTATPVDEAVKLFNRENALQLVIADSAIGGLQINGIFWADDPEGFVRLLEAGMNVRAERKDGTILLHRR